MPASFLGAWQAEDEAGCRFRLAIAPNAAIVLMKYERENVPAYAALGRGRTEGRALRASLAVYCLAQFGEARETVAYNFVYRPAADALWDGQMIWRRSGA